MRALVLLLLVAIASLGSDAKAQDFSRNGPYPVATTTVTIQRGDLSSFEALLYYPSTRSGAPYPAVSFGHGFLTPPWLYEPSLQHLASWGYVVIATRSGLEPFPRHDEFAMDLIWCLDHLVAESGRTGSFLEGMVASNRLGVSGHSMGGGASLLAAAMDPMIRAVGNTAAAETRPSAIAAAAAVDAPVLLIAGSDDTIVPIDRHTGRMYDSASAPKLLAVLRGGSHCGFVDVPLPDAVCDEASIPLDVQLRETRAMLAAFFELYLKGNTVVWPQVWGLTRLLNPAWQMDVNPGSLLQPRASTRRVRPGQSADVSLRITNTGPVPASFVLGVAGGGIPVQPIPSSTGVLAPGASVPVTFRVTPPPGRASTRVVQVYAHPAGDPATRSVAALILLGSR